MKTLLTAILCLCSVSLIHAQSASLQRAQKMDFKTHNGGAEMSNHTTAVDPAGNMYVAGTLSGTVDFDPGPGTVNLTSRASIFSAFIAKYDAQGALVWAKHIDASKLIYLKAMTLDARGDLLLTGSFRDTVDFDPGPGVQKRIVPTNSAVNILYAGYVLKLDTSGAFAWVTTIDDASANPLIPGQAGGDAITVDTAGNAYVVGSFSEIVSFGGVTLTGQGQPQLSDEFVCKLGRATGAVSWVVGYNGNANENHSRATGISTDINGNVYIIGELDSGASSFKPVDFDPGPGKYELSPIGRSDLYILKLKPNGAFGWAKQVGGRGFESAGYLTMDASANLYIAGSFMDTVDFDPGAGISKIVSAGGYDGYFLKLDSSGAFMWVKEIAGPGDEYPTLISTDATGNIYLGGSFDSTADFNPGSGIYNITSHGSKDAFVLKLDPSGSFTWAAAVGGPGYENLYGLGLDAAGNIYGRGVFNNTADFDPCPTVYNLTADQNSQTFLLKLSQSPFNCPTAGVGTVSSENALSLYPNPASNSVTVACESGFQDTRIRLQNISGQVVEEWRGVNGKSASLNISAVPAGMYFIEVSAGDGNTQRLRLVKQ